MKELNKTSHLTTSNEKENNIIKQLVHQRTWCQDMIVLQKWTWEVTDFQS